MYVYFIWNKFYYFIPRRTTPPKTCFVCFVSLANITFIGSIYVCSFILSSVWLFCWILCKEKEKKNVTALYVWFSGVSQMVVGGCCACRILYYTWYIRYDGVDSLIPQVTNTMVFAGKIYFSQKQLLFGGKKMK